ncbi:MAG: hypothetical protein MJZ64_01535 [Paludibacteraceae bacterium]|nr:hypothetical protein [Paludibacteraceae bacterium]
MHMRKYYILLYIALIPLFVDARTRSYSRTSAQADNYHFGYVSAAAGYTSLSQNIHNVQTTGDLGYLVGAGYEFRRTSFWLSVGAQYLQEKSKTDVNTFDFYPKDANGNFLPSIDDQKPAKNRDYCRYTINQTDQQVLRTIDIPVMLGYYYNGFYVGAGAKIGFSIGSKESTSGTYELSAKYTDYMEEFHNVNYYTTYSIGNRQYNYNFRPQFSVIGEIGYDLLSSISTNSAICHVLKIGFYFEYGLRSLRQQNSMDIVYLGGKPIETPDDLEGKRVCDATINPFYMSKATDGKWVVPFFVGLKLTYMIGGNRYATGTWHKGCMCYQ